MKNLYAFLLLSFLSGTTLLSQPPAGAETANELIYDYTDEGGGYYVRTIIHFNNLGSDPDDPALHTRAKNIMEYINSVYNPHGIYFVAISECSGSPVYHDCGEPEDEVPYSLDLLTSSPPCNNALSIFDLGDAGTYNGWAHTVPGLLLRVQGSYNGLPASQAPTIIHEIGHALGLIHTYVGFTDNNGTLDACYLDPDECWDPNYPNLELCICCEDNVCDTELTPNELVVDYDNDCLLTSHSGWGLTEDQYRNYMIGATANPQFTSQTQLCTDRFSPGQVARMRAYLRLSTILDPILIKTTAYSGTLPGGVYGNIVVESGETLEITSPIEMLPGAYIEVEKGARLEVKSTVTGFGCDGMWRGIIVEGTTQASQTTQNQGKVFINYQGRIEHAMIGIEVQGVDAFDQPKPGTGGGIVTISSGKLVDCSIGIRFGPYSWGSGNNQVQANTSNLVGAEFSVTDDYRSDTRPTLLDLTAIARLNVYACTFSDLRSDCNSPLDRAIGIDAKNATFRVSSNSRFRHLSAGIRASALDLLNGSFSVISCGFEACYRGIMSNEFSSFRILSNDFEVRMPDGCEPSPGQKEVKGIEIKGNTAGFGLHGNSFYYDGTSLPDETTIGTDCIGLGAGTANTVRDNNYTNLYVSNRAMGNNGYEITPSSDGLVYLCNTSEFTFSPDDPEILNDYLVTDGSSIRMVQGEIIFGSVTLPTGNIFSDEGYTFNNFGQSIDYYYYGGDVYQDPSSVGIVGAGTFLMPVGQPNGNCPGLPGPPCDPCTTGSELTQLKTHFYQIRRQWLDENSELLSITDSVKMEATIDTIAFLRLEMNKNANRILRHYEQDTAVIEVDTLLAWLQLAETYPADLRLASHYFFTGDFDAYDSLWSRIPVKFDLQSLPLDEFEELGEVYDLIRTHVESKGAMNQLPKTLTDSLFFWAGWCSEPGFLAQNLLWQNGIETEADCQSSGMELKTLGKKKETQKQVVDLLRAYPNPADEMIRVELSDSFDEGYLMLFNLQGILVLNQTLPQHSNQINLSTVQIPPGIYLMEIRSFNYTSRRLKVVISH